MGLLDFFKKAKTERKVVLIGLDGTPYTLLKQYIEDGTMPNLARITNDCLLKQMDVSIPEVSSTSWTCFYTGCNPAQHGIFGFLDLQPNSYKIYFPNSRNVKMPALWDIVGNSGKRSVVINVPQTYPAKQTNGVLISGFVATDIKKATYPAELLPTLSELGYRLDPDAARARESKEAFIEDILDVFEKRRRTILHLFEHEKWSLFIGTVTETDRLHHFMWDAAVDPNHKYHDAFKEFYRRVDKLLGEVYERLDTSTTFMMCSDHGFTKIEQQVYLNYWLKSNGYLSFTSDTPKSIEEIGSNSRAFALDPTRIYINLKGKYPQGTVSTGEYERLRSEIADGLLSLEHNGQRILQRVFMKEEIFRGPLLEQAPDLVVLSNYGYDMKGATNKQVLMDTELFTGMHTQDDAHLLIGRRGTARPSIERKPHICDIAPTILKELDIAVPPDMVGRALV
ncbi:MAG: alkaline phosphatase family protein [Acidobacteriota bacterium]|nr:alkaline phosphatase family protein [Blastocatellia bacterium]MDW8412686.1 alkaline phosphatase family protein [Acidobacteriota bacterium]